MSAIHYIAREWQCHAATSVGYEVDGKFHHVAECSGFGRSAEEAERTATQIVVALNAYADLLAVLQEVGEWFALTKPPLDQWEDLAEEFRKETGFLRPGKSYPMAAGLDEEREAERTATWAQWVEKRRADMIARVRAALAKATGSGS